MKALVVIAVGLLMGGCGLNYVHTGHVSTDGQGNKYERHYLIIPIDSACTGGCEEHVKRAKQALYKDYPHYK